MSEEETTKEMAEAEEDQSEVSEEESTETKEEEKPKEVKKTRKRSRRRKALEEDEDSSPYGITMIGEAKALIKKPILVIVFLLGILVASLLVMLMLDLAKEQYAERVTGYVKINHKIPEWHHGELPEAAKQHLENYRRAKEKVIESLTIMPKDKKAHEPIVGENYNPIKNEQFLEILKKQKLGRTARDGVEKPERMNLSGLNLSKLDYKYFKVFVASNLRYTDFSGINEAHLEFRGASLAYSQFVDARLDEINFVRSFLSFSNFYNAKVNNCLFIGAAAQKAHFKSAQLRHCNFSSSIFKESDFENTKIIKCNFKESYLEGSNFSNSDLTGSNFKDTDLHGASFAYSDLTGVDFTNAKLEGANFTGANLQNTKFKNTDVTQAVFADVQNASFDQLNQAKFLLSAKSIPKELIPKKYSWRERFTVPQR